MIEFAEAQLLDPEIGSEFVGAQRDVWDAESPARALDSTVASRRIALAKLARHVYTVGGRITPYS
jgi:uncharacterized membrane protein YjdF